MIYGSVCSGIEAATQAWHPLGWTPAFFSEIEKFPSAVLAHHYGSNMPGEAPTSNGVPNLGDMTKFEEWPDYAIDLLVGGTPCQSFSVAGLRKGLDDPRGNLMLTFGAIAQRYRPSWVVWENVPGVLSDDGGRGFASLLGLLSGRRIEVPHDGWRNAGVVPGYQGAYGLAWRVLDAQYIRVDGFGRAVPQRRRRVFVVGYLGDWRGAAAVLLEREGMRGDSPPRREAGQNVAPTISSRPTGGGGLGTDFDLDGGLIEAFGRNNTSGPIDVATGVNAHGGPAGRLDFESETFVAQGVAPSITRNPYGDHESREGLLVAHEVAGTMKAMKDSGGWSNSADHAAAGYMVAHTLKAEGFDASEDGTGRGTPIVPVIAKTLTRGAESSGKGGYAGRRQEDDDNLVAYPLTSGMAASAARMPHEQGALLPVAFAQNSRDEVRLFGGDGQTVGALAAEPGMKQTTYVAVANEEKTLQSIGVKQGKSDNASTEKADARALLRSMREQVGEEAFTQWGLGILDTLQSPEVLRSEVHGGELRQEAQGGPVMVGGASRSEITSVSGAMRAVRIAGRERRPPPGQKLSKQCQGELGAHLSELPQSGAFAEAFMLDLWEASQGLRILRQALSALQEVWRPDADTRQSAHPAWAVRRLTPVECARLQGFPDRFCNIPWRGKDHAPDGPQYKALGNSMAVNCMRWLGMRIEMVEAILKDEAA